ncbi:helix-turn-helix domain-containing protein [Mesorhizobium sp. M0615]|uniref:GlxA family transcriptional regulator n=1 Tax=Mesorhizobium sp. M0615 TaxID=2956971 RepID=UPI003338DB66
MKEAANSIHVVFVLIPRFTLSTLALGIDALRVINRVALQQLFTWDIVTPDGAPAISSSDIPVTPTKRLQEISCAPVTLVLASWEFEAGYQQPLLAWLRRQDRQKGVLGSVESGAFILAKAGLLRSGEAAVHFESRSAFSDKFGSELVTDDRWILTDRRASCSGVISLFDMILALTERELGRELAQNVADIMCYRPPSQASSADQLHRDQLLIRADQGLVRAIEVMHANLENPISLTQICKTANLSVWRLRRLFKRELDQAPSAYYMGLRLRRARELLEHGREKVQNIALSCGFADAPSFSTAFRRLYGMSPTECRDRLR